MSTSQILDHLRTRILAGYSLLFLQTAEEARWEEELASLAFELERGLAVWSVTEGLRPPLNADSSSTNPLQFLQQVGQYPANHLFYVKDFHPYLRDPQVLRTLRDLPEVLAAARQTLLLVGPVAEIPLELRTEAIRLELPLPGIEELRDELAAVQAEQRQNGSEPIKLEADDEERLLKAVLGLTSHEARKALARGLLGRSTLDDDVYPGLVSEKRRLIQGSDLLEFYDLEEGIEDVGGLDSLKDWLKQRATAFSTRAQQQGIPTPKGVLLLGVQGCGKSLTARATAKLLSFPLIRLDVSALLSAGVGESEKNMRDVLRMVETLAPAVLWLDEIEKGFAGLEGEAAHDATMSRLFGTFLTWMEERHGPVFVTATANSITHLPPELLRRGRFDELFFIDLPNYYERKHILRVHLSRRGWKPQKFDIEGFAGRTEGYSGAEIEQIVTTAMVDAFSEDRILTDEDLGSARDETVPLSVTREEEIFHLREWAKDRCRQATPDSRVLQMLEEEQRRGEFVIDSDEQRDAALQQKWVTLADYGQLQAALVEYVGSRSHVTFPQLQDDFADYVATTGEQGLALRSDPNVVLWVGLHQELAELLSRLIAAKRIYVHPAARELYEAQDRSMRLPVLESLPVERAGRPMWLPACLKISAPAEPDSRLTRVARMKLSR